MSDLYPRFWIYTVRISQALYWIFIGPLRPFIDLFILLPVDIALYVLQWLSWVFSIIPVFLWVLGLGYQAHQDRLYWLAVWMIIDFRGVYDAVSNSDGQGYVIMLYFLWPLLLAWWWAKFMVMQLPDYFNAYHYSDVGYCWGVNSDNAIYC